MESERQAAEELRWPAQLEREHRRAERHKERARRLAEGLKSIHRALFEGNVFTLILRACLNITGASRGLYVTAWGQDELRVRAAVDLDGYPQGPPSPFIRSLCRKVLDDQQTFLCNGPECFADLPQPDRSAEHFRNCVVAPVVLLKNLNGVVIIADKIEGDFDDADAEVVLSVGDQASVAVENQRLQRELTGALTSPSSACWPMPSRPRTRTRKVTANWWPATPDGRRPGWGCPMPSAVSSATAVCCTTSARLASAMACSTSRASCCRRSGI